MATTRCSQEAIQLLKNPKIAPRIAQLEQRVENAIERAMETYAVSRERNVAELARMVAMTCGFSGELRFDPTKPDGTPRKLLDVSRLTRLGWRPKIALKSGLESTYDWFRANEHRLRS